MKSLVGPAGHTQVNDFNSMQKGVDQKVALKPLSFLTRGYDHLQVVCAKQSHRAAHFPLHHLRSSAEAADAIGVVAGLIAATPGKAYRRGIDADQEVRWIASCERAVSRKRTNDISVSSHR